MKLRFLSSILIFVSAYSPLSIIFLIQDLDLPIVRLKHPYIVWFGLRFGCSRLHRPRSR